MADNIAVAAAISAPANASAAGTYSSVNKITGLAVSAIVHVRLERHHCALTKASCDIVDNDHSDMKALSNFRATEAGPVA